MASAVAATMDAMVTMATVPSDVPPGLAGVRGIQTGSIAMTSGARRIVSVAL